MLEAETSGGLFSALARTSLVEHTYGLVGVSAPTCQLSRQPQVAVLDARPSSHQLPSNDSACTYRNTPCGAFTHSLTPSRASTSEAFIASRARNLRAVLHAVGLNAMTACHVAGIWPFCAFREICVEPLHPFLYV